MALIHIAGKVNRPGRRRRPVAVRFLVDTGAVYTVLPETVWRALGLMVNPLTRELLPMRLMLAGATADL